MSEKVAKHLRGAAAIEDMLGAIGREDANDGDIAKILVENEMAIRSFVNFGLAALSQEMPK